MKTIGMFFVVTFFLITYLITSVVWGPLSVFILHVTYGLIAFAIMLLSFRKTKVIKKIRGNLGMTATLAVFIIFGGFSLYTIISLLDEHSTKCSKCQ